jgi:hypothetical protein
MKKIALNQTLVIISLIFIFTYAWSKYIFFYYTAGDQIIYGLFFERSIGKSFLEIFALQRGFLGASEPGFSWLIYLVNDILSKSTFMSLANAFLSVLFYLFIKDRKYAWLIFTFFILNYYTSVLFFSAERLKFAVIALLLVQKIQKPYLKGIMLIVPGFFHFQYLTILPILYGRYLLANPSFMFFTFVAFLSGIFLIYFQFGDMIILKYYAYSNNFNMIGLGKALILGVILMTVSNQRKFDFLVAIYFLFLTVLLGADRIVSMEIIYLLLIIRFYNVYQFIVFFTLSLYLILKLVSFYQLVFNCSHGFISLVDPCF